jgi:hypothetical protein
MAENRLARALPRLIAQADTIRLAAPDLWQRIGLKHNSPERLAEAIATVRLAVKRYCAARRAKIETTAHRRRVDNAAWDFIRDARNVLSNLFGHQYSERWAALNFPGYSLRIPQRLDQRLALLANIACYFRAHPEHEIAGYATASLAARHYDDLLAATNDINHCRAEVRAARTARDRAVTALRRQIRSITRELSMLLGKDDPRWHTFGLNIPSTTRRRRTAKTERPTAPAVAPAPEPSLASASHPTVGQSQLAPASDAQPSIPLDPEDAASLRPSTCDPQVVISQLPVLFSRPALPRAHRKRSWLASLIPSWN